MGLTHVQTTYIVIVTYLTGHHARPLLNSKHTIQTTKLQTFQNSHDTPTVMVLYLVNEVVMFCKGCDGAGVGL